MIRPESTSPIPSRLFSLEREAVLMLISPEEVRSSVWKPLLLPAVM
ncbi:MAG: hypothetical protein V5A59_13560 [Bacteroidales bacterium]